MREPSSKNKLLKNKMAMVIHLCTVMRSTIPTAPLALQARAKRTDLQSILILGSGSAVIGQAAEFDYSGTQAVRALREEGYRVILVNSNPATNMTDPDLADATYIEPIPSIASS
jgi:hypothetical protein